MRTSVYADHRYRAVSVRRLYPGGVSPHNQLSAALDKRSQRSQCSLIWAQLSKNQLLADLMSRSEHLGFLGDLCADANSSGSRIQLLFFRTRGKHSAPVLGQFGHASSDRS